jgi:hypothetical protein
MRNSVAGWKYVGKKKAKNPYGTQRCYDRIEQFLDATAEEIPF